MLTLWTLTFCWHFVDILLTFCRHFVDILLTFCWHFVDILLTFCQHFVNTLLTFCWHFVDTLLTFCWHFVDTLLTFWGSPNMKPAFWRSTFRYVHGLLVGMELILSFRNLYCIVVSYFLHWDQCCQMVCFQNKNPNWGRSLYSLRKFGLFYGQLV
jgi:hypothetical protein